MGAWSEGPFDNDTAADWAHEFDGADRERGLQMVRAALEAAAATSADDYLDADAGAEAVAAAELVAAMRGLDVEKTSYSQSALAWVEATRATAEDQLVDLAVGALDRVTGEDSELVELWDEAGPTWRQVVDRRRASLRRT